MTDVPDRTAAAAILFRGIKMGLHHAARSVFHEDDLRAILSIDALQIAREAALDTLTAEAQAQGMGYDND